MDSPESIGAKVQADVDSGKFSVEEDGEAPPPSSSATETETEVDSRLAATPAFADSDQPDQPTASQPPPVQNFRPINIGGRMLTPDDLRTEQGWEEFQKLASTGLMFQDDYTRKRQAEAEYTKQLRQYEGQLRQREDQLNRYWQTMESPAGKQLLVEEFQRRGWQLPPELLAQAQFDPLSPVRREIAELKATYERERAEQYQVQAQAENLKAIDQTWEGLKKANPLITEEDFEMWSGIQMGENPETPEQYAAVEKRATERVAAYKKSLYSPETIQKLPKEVQDQLRRHFTRDYVRTKTEQAAFVPTSSGGAPAATTVGRQGGGRKLPNPAVDMEAYNRAVQEDLKGRLG